MSFRYKYFMLLRKYNQLILIQQGALPVNTATKTSRTQSADRYLGGVLGAKQYTVMQRIESEDDNGQPVVAYIPQGTGLKATKKEASKDMRALGGGRKGTRSDLVVYSFITGQAAEKEYTVSVVVKAKSQAHAADILSKAGHKVA